MELSEGIALENNCVNMAGSAMFTTFHCIPPRQWLPVLALPGIEIQNAVTKKQYG